MNTTTLWMNQLSWVDYQRRIRTGHPPVLLPVGALEQHGPHLPLGTDALLAGAVAADAATLIGQVRDAVREFARHGVDKLVIVNGHYENQWFLIEGIDLGLRDAKAADPACALQVMRLEYWDFMTPETLGHVFPEGFPGFALEHAAVLETSMMLHHHPSLVRMDLLPDDGPADFPPYDMYPSRTDWVPPSGVLSSAKGSDATKGKLLADEVARRMAEAITTGFTRP
ncbi:creatininase family protein [Hydrogenophaga pseudoflava]|uniref:Creatinine amidohydrolase n=1 Tax=Hydrogenophaga pseudoflava TaxID=47421 RepID=A0A4P6WV81_HYDPS|nr:creatininase family protein [Hydrogenophaga pseudoflava]QBM26105.1 Creatinine amidohydrolase [Hydrogenophaga pseudoflava]